MRHDGSRNYGALEHDHIRAALIRDLADGTVSRAELARRYGASRQAVVRFAARHRVVPSRCRHCGAASEARS